MRLYTRTQTARGPRTTIVQGLCRTDAFALMEAAYEAGGEGYVDEDGPQISLRDHMKAHAERKKAIASGKNVTQLRRPKRT